MKNLHLVYIGFVLLTAVACSDDVRNDPALNGNIQLGVTVGNLQINSRATADPFLLQNGIPLKAAVWFRNHDGVYEHNPDASTNLPVHTVVEFDGTQPTYVLYENKNLKYPTGDMQVNCVGLYPESGWNVTDNKIVSHVIDGENDLMFAPEIAGSWTNNFPVQKYEHLLTWIKIDICAASHDAVDAWGTIKQITVNSASEVTVDLQNVDFKTVQCLYSEQQQEIKTIPDDGGGPLTTTIHEVGSVFCSPKKEYTVTVTTVNKNGEEIKKTLSLKLNIIDIDDNDKVIELTDDSEARGRCFVFSLYFTPYNVIEGTCTLNSWSNQNEDIYVN